MTMCTQNGLALKVLTAQSTISEPAEQVVKSKVSAYTMTSLAMSSSAFNLADSKS